MGGDTGRGGPSTLVVRCSSFALPKAGHRADEYEDAWCASGENRLPFRAAVADGATEAIFAGDWARRLARGFVEAGPERLGEKLKGWQAAWAASVEARREAMPWYAAAKAEEGAFAALLGLALRRGGTWRAVAVGDCCLFHLRDGEEASPPWPVDAPEAFGNRPVLLPSRPGHRVPALHERSGRFEAGDVFVLATDAAAAWLLRAGPATARQLDAGRFATTVREARHAGTLRSDDTTVLVLEIGAP